MGLLTIWDYKTQTYTTWGSPVGIVTPQIVPLTTPDVNDVITALVSLGLITQSD